jgi:hypothetical protein
MPRHPNALMFVSHVIAVGVHMDHQWLVCEDFDRTTQEAALINTVTSLPWLSALPISRALQMPQCVDDFVATAHCDEVTGRVMLQIEFFNEQPGSDMSLG